MNDQSMHPRPDADLDTRTTAQKEFGLPLVVEAGAGTGKTTLLVARVVAWCLGRGWDTVTSDLEDDAADERVAARVLERVVAVTFTDAAAAEMARKVSRAFAQVAAGRIPVGIEQDLIPEVDVRCSRAAELLGQIHHLTTRTIHSFCQALLQNHPVEAGVHPGFRVDVDGLEVAETSRRVVEEALRDAFDTGDPTDWLELAAHGEGPQQVAEALTTLIQSGVLPDDLGRGPFPPDVIEEWDRRLRASLQRFLRAEGGRLATLSPKYIAARMCQALNSFSNRLASTEPVPRVSYLELLSEEARAAAEVALKRLSEWADGDFKNIEARSLGDAAAEVAAAAGDLARLLGELRDLHPIALETARRLMNPLLEDALSRLRAAGIVTFHDLLVRARDLLVGDLVVRGLVRAGIDQLLVDEFQDTDPVQCEIVEQIALDGPHEERPGLFLVGDPKQSIYGWRDADLRAYNRFVRTALEGRAPLPLVVNRRSVPAILNEVTRVVEPVMQETEDLQPGFVDLVPSDDRTEECGFDQDHWAPVEHWVSWPADQETGGPAATQATSRATALEAKAVARDLVRLHSEAGVGWRDIAILMRSVGDIDVYLEGLRDRGIPYEVARDREYYRRREIVEIAAVVRWLLDPGDRLALLTVLRSDVFGTPDAALLPLWRRGFPGVMAGLGGNQQSLEAAIQMLREVAGELPADVPGLDRVRGWQEAAVFAVQVLNALRAAFVEQPPHRFVERLRTLWLAEATASARYLGSFRRAILDQFFVDLERILADSGEVHRVGRFLRRAVEEGLESHEPPRPQPGLDAVQVMTIHRAKGLDFKHVYLVQLHRGDSRSRALGTEVRVHDERREYALFGWPTPGLLRAKAWDRRVVCAERVRLLYVAMTRAKDRLVLAGHWPSRPEAKNPHRSRSIMDLVAGRGIDVGYGDQVESNVARREDAHGALWLVPLFEEAADDGRPVYGEDAIAPSSDQVLADAQRLSDARRRAEVRMARPVGAPVTDEIHRLDDVEAQASLIEEGHRSAMGSRAASAVGSQVHRLMEVLDLDEELASQVRAHRSEFLQPLAAVVSADEFGAAQERMSNILERIEHGDCLSTLSRVADRVVARELPLLLPPIEHGRAVGYVSGVADLVYREGGRLVVADYKTDAVATEADIQQRIDMYRPQLELYARALHEALELERPPFTELWFLDADRIVRL